ncbi:MAG TPA: hypothetical protein VM243_21635 [Phycisphaerae bacterium]|nr:hypothetical protein [Phycisphaerae bacterium]
MGDERDIADVSRFLREAGLGPERIREGNSRGCKRCDLWAEDGHENYLIEVKAFYDDATINETLRKGDIHERVHLHVYRDNVAKGIRHAIRQVESTAREYADALWLVALIARSEYDACFMSEQMIGTLYGVGAISDCGADGGCRRRRCLYFSDSAFHRHPVLDGAILWDRECVALYLNDYGRRLARVRRSRLACFLAQHNALHDKDTMESRSDDLVADFEMDRTDEQAVLERLKEKYPGRDLQQRNWQRWEGIGVSSPRQGEGV